MNFERACSDSADTRGRSTGRTPSSPLPAAPLLSAPSRLPELRPERKSPPPMRRTRHKAPLYWCLRDTALTRIAGEVMNCGGEKIDLGASGPWAKRDPNRVGALGRTKRLDRDAMTHECMLSHDPRIDSGLHQISENAWRRRAIP